MAWARVRRDSGKTSTGTHSPPSGGEHHPDEAHGPAGRLLVERQPEEQAQRDEGDGAGPQHADQRDPRAQAQLHVVDEPADEGDHHQAGQGEQGADGDVDREHLLCGTGVTRSCRSQPDARSKESRMVAPRAAPIAPYAIIETM